MSIESHATEPRENCFPGQRGEVAKGVNAEPPEGVDEVPVGQRVDSQLGEKAGIVGDDLRGAIGSPGSPVSGEGALGLLDAPVGAIDALRQGG